MITAAADDDPSGIATYSIAGALAGTSLLWTALFTWPLMAAVQMMCARIGLMTGRGLTEVLKRKFPKPFVIVITGALFVANTINIGADLVAMADAIKEITGFNSDLFVIALGAIIATATVQFRYAQIVNALKWLVLSLFAYVITAFITHPDWSAVLRHTLTPSLPHGSEAWGILVAILGTTISPYLFFWQAAQEVEEKKAEGSELETRLHGCGQQQITNRKIDVAVGSFLSNAVMFFIILSCA
ncbi:MAG TPA: Nramp family divalent metal transporter, partial [Opitutaceae bacterium]|nr:Nramp family divalent metal transporter [Opitutaceae bacterium]